MQKIFKYDIPVHDEFVLDLPIGARILDVQVQHIPRIWVMINPDQQRTEVRRFRLVGTGHPIDDDMIRQTYIGTFQLHHVGLVFHLFEI